MREHARDLAAPARLVVFVAALALIGGAAALAGAATGHERVAKQPRSGDAMRMAMHADLASEDRAGGLAVSAAGYTLVPERVTLPLAKPISFRFRIIDRHGDVVKELDLDGGVRLHLIVVRRDFVGYQHMHPALGPGGNWSVPLTLAASGVYRVFADFDVAGKKTVLGSDLFVPGAFTPVPLPTPTNETATDGFAVALAPADLRAGEPTELRFTVSRNGRPVPSFQPYVGYRGHLIALRDGDLEYSHVHPLPDGAPGEVSFHAELPTAGRYRLFFQFKVGSDVHTAPFTVQVKR